jgi:hypothetical protein
MGVLLWHQNMAPPLCSLTKLTSKPLSNQLKYINAITNYSITIVNDNATCKN